MKRLIWMAAWALVATGCDDSTTGPSPVVPIRGELHFVPADSRVPRLPCQCPAVATPCCRQHGAPTDD